ncbi:MAG TPA: helix-turn-helix domain-containing protein [Nocardioides sp.]|uniref:PucR family transcriptional regulator n=1 Tax=Nocardioides sp. TaxID=35761 RepID=UPI002F42D30B
MTVPDARPTRITLDPRLLDLLRRRLPEVATHTIAAVTDEVPSYAGAFGGPMVDNVENAVQMALAGFLRLAARGRVVDQAQPLSPALEGAYALGRGEARSGRSADALLSAYRVGARVAWRELAETAVTAGVPADMLADFAELVFAYIDELSAASVAGHADELETSGRVRQGYLDRLAFGILRGDPADALVAAAERADWTPPRTLTVVILPSAQVRPVQGLLDLRTLTSVGEPANLPDDLGVLLVPDVGGRARTRLMRTLTGRAAVAGPARPWLSAATSYARALRALDLRAEVGDDATYDTEEHLADLVLAADREAVSDLRARVLAPLADLRPATRQKLAETLRAWLLHQGRRDEVAAALFVHPQTVRYRMGQLRELYGERLEDPTMIRDLTLALA